MPMVGVQQWGWGHGGRDSGDHHNPNFFDSSCLTPTSPYIHLSPLTERLWLLAFGSSPRPLLASVAFGVPTIPFRFTRNFIFNMSASFATSPRLLVPAPLSTFNRPPLQHGDAGTGSLYRRRIQEDAIRVLFERHSNTALRSQSAMDAFRLHPLAARPQGHETWLR